MIKVETIHDFLKTDHDTLKHLDVEQLRILLGVFRFTVRCIEREINDRELILGEANGE